jgi:RNA polymerase primary sigma factor
MSDASDDRDSALRAEREFEWRPRGGVSRPGFVGAAAQTTVAPRPISSPPHVWPLPALSTLELYAWQQRGLEAWHKRGSRGVIEAVTGAGKTRLALQAILYATAEGRKAAVIVPTLDLVRQWNREIRVHVAPRSQLSLRLGMLGGGSQDDLRSCDILVSTAASAAHWQMLSRSEHDLLVADECHHYGADVWSRGLEAGFGQRLGLTATYEREDDGIETLLDPYFGGVCYSVGYEEALRDGVIAPFKIAFIGTQFSPAESSAYEDAATKAGKYRQRLITDWGLPAEPFGRFMREVQKLRLAEIPEGSKLAGFYLSAFTKRRKLMAESAAKLDLVASLSPAIGAAQRTIVFAQTVAAADRAIRRLRAAGHSGAVIEASLDAEERRDTFAAFERGDYAVVAAPKLLDEGVDVPAADLAIVLATSRSRRQLIQRMGRVIRKKQDGRPARVVILYVQGTAEDPETGGHEDFLDEVTGAAREVRIFRPAGGAADAIRYLDPKR